MSMELQGAVLQEKRGSTRLLYLVGDEQRTENGEEIRLKVLQGKLLSLRNFLLDMLIEKYKRHNRWND